MSKEFLIETFQNIHTNKYVWALYFFKIDRRNSNPYSAYKIRFKNTTYLPEYACVLMNMIEKFQISKIEEVHNYTGENTKVSCDKISIEDELIKEPWNYLVKDVAEASDEKISGKYNGYIIEGTPETVSESLKPIIAVKLANPVINLTNKKSMVFSFDENQELVSLADEVCKLYMDVDFIVLDGNMYTFNYKFEDMFHVEKTMQKLKNKAIDTIVEIDAFSDVDMFLDLAKSYKSPRTFITLNQERLTKISDQTKRDSVAEMLKIDLDESGKFLLKNAEEATLLIKYLCYKVFKDGETQDILEANNISKVDL